MIFLHRVICCVAGGVIFTVQAFFLGPGLEMVPDKDEFTTSLNYYLICLLDWDKFDFGNTNCNVEFWVWWELDWAWHINLQRLKLSHNNNIFPSLPTSLDLNHWHRGENLRAVLPILWFIYMFLCLNSL